MSAALTPIHDQNGRRNRGKDMHTISLFVKDEPGVLVRVAMVFSPWLAGFVPVPT